MNDCNDTGNNTDPYCIYRKKQTACSSQAAALSSTAVAMLLALPSARRLCEEEPMTDEWPRGSKYPMIDPKPYPKWFLGSETSNVGYFDPWSWIVVRIWVP